MNPFPILKAAIDKVPAVKYALGLAGIAAAAAIIKLFNIEENHSLPVISLLAMLGLMLLLFIFSTLIKSNKKPITIAGYILVFTMILILCGSGLLLASSVFFNYPKSVDEYVFWENRSEKEKKKAVGEVEKMGMAWIEESKTIRAIQATKFTDEIFQNLIPSFVALQPDSLEISFNPMPSSTDEFWEQYQFSTISGLDKVKSLKGLTIRYSFHLTSLKPLSSLHNLTSLNLRMCDRLSSLEGIENLISLQTLGLQSTLGLQNLDGIQNLINLEYLNLESCPALNNFNSLIRLKLLKTLNVSVSKLSSTAGINSLGSLENLDMHSCQNLKEIDGMNGLKNLSTLNLANCQFLQNVNGLKDITSLTWLHLGQCGYLTDISALEGLHNLEYLFLFGDLSLQDINPLNKLGNLKELSLKGCPKITIDQIKKLQEALPKTNIVHD